MKDWKMEEIKLILNFEPLHETNRGDWAKGFVSALARFGIIDTEELAEFINFITERIKS